MNSPTDTVEQPPVLHSASGEGGPVLHRKIAKLPASTDPPLPYPISEMNISDWKNTGYCRHLAQQERLALVRANREDAGEMVSSQDITTLPESPIQGREYRNCALLDGEEDSLQTSEPCAKLTHKSVRLTHWESKFDRTDNRRGKQRC